ncbi:sigma-70 family RNA polymerase sigma factor [Thermoleophilia bacterium SCSIO 60948]|nr:sigma-70 family RNA polymerase sigma factor [Thermoleophilia bacterium SCSIO 60948]
MDASVSHRSQAAVAAFRAHGTALRTTARRVSICDADADEALGRALEICLRKVPRELAPEHLAGWMHVVTRREALAVRRSRERSMSGGEDSLARLPSAESDPFDVVVRGEAVTERLAVLGQLKPHERLAIALQAAGYSYAEIREHCGWTYTKVNRCLAEGRARLRELEDATLAA